MAISIVTFSIMRNRLSGIVKWSYLLGFFILVSCHKDRRTELFELNHFVDFDIQPGLNTFDTHFFVISPLASTYQQKLSAAGVNPDDVVGVEAKEASLSGIFGDVNLKFIDQISIYIFDPFNPADKVEFFYLDPVPFKNTTVIHLFPGIADIGHWAKEDFFGIEIRLNFRDVTSSFTPMRLEFDIRALGN
jgi:hypothetical protein